MLGVLQKYIPGGELLDDETFHRRHLLLSLLLAAHIPALAVFALVRGFAPVEAALYLVPVLPFLAVGRLVHERRVSAFFIAAGLVCCAGVLVYLSGGMIEAHFHFFVLIGFIALYQDWVPFGWNIIFVVLSHGLGSALAPDAMYDHHAAQNSPWLWALIHGVAVLAACTGVGIYWRSAEDAQRRSTAMASDLAAAEVSAAEAETARRRSESELLVHLARRNQSLLDRQLALISGLGDGEDVFKLDHLATRMRRNAESLLVLAGEEPPRRRGESVRLADVIRAAAAAVEDYGRVELTVHDYIEVHSAAVEDLVHLLAELVENATLYSSPTTRVRVRTLLPPGDDLETIVVVEDNGIGMPEVELARANRVLAGPLELEGSWSTLGFQVVSRLAQRHQLRVWLEQTTGGGVTALVALPGALVGRRHLAVSSAGAIADGDVEVVERDDTGDGVQWRAVDVGTAARLRVPALPQPAVPDSKAPGALAGAAAMDQRLPSGRDDGLGWVEQRSEGAVDDDQVAGSEQFGRPFIASGSGRSGSMVHEASGESAAALDGVDDTVGGGSEGSDGADDVDRIDGEGTGEATDGSDAELAPGLAPLLEELPVELGELEKEKPRPLQQRRTAGDRAAASAMLSQFQASQRAGRIVTGQQQDRREEDPGDRGDDE